MNKWMTILAVVGSIAAIERVAAQEDKATPAVVEKIGMQEIDKLIKQLGADDFETREAAMRTLGECDEALPQLREAAKSADLETKLRAEGLAATISDRLEEKALKSWRRKLTKSGWTAS
jgi:hypothetical protein